MRCTLHVLYICSRQRNLIGYVREIWEGRGGGVKGGGKTFGMKIFFLHVVFRCGAKGKKGWVIQNDTSHSVFA